MQYAPSPYHPLATIDPTGHHPQLRVLFLLTAATSAFLYMGGLLAVIVPLVVDPSHPEPVFILVGYAAVLFGALLLYVKLGLALYWLHGAWKWVPIDQRAGRDGKRYTPDGVFMLLIPYYHWYWQFPINLGLCDAMERLRQASRTMTPPKRDVAMWAAICEIIPFANFFVAPFLWASYMKSIDVMHDELASAMAQRA